MLALSSSRQLESADRLPGRQERVLTPMGDEFLIDPDPGWQDDIRRFAEESHRLRNVGQLLCEPLAPQTETGSLDGY